MEVAVTPEPTEESSTERVVELAEGEHLIEVSDELLFRQVTKYHRTADGKLGSHVFGPADADRGKPSYSRSSATNAQASRDWHTQNARTPSLAVLAVSSREVAAAKTHAIDDSGAPLVEGQDDRPPGHCFVDYRDMANPQVKTVRGILLRFALGRGEIATTPERADGELEIPAADEG